MSQAVTRYTHRYEVQTQNTTYYVSIYKEVKHYEVRLDFRVWGTNGRYFDGQGDPRDQGMRVGGYLSGDKGTGTVVTTEIKSIKRINMKEFERQTAICAEA